MLLVPGEPIRLREIEPDPRIVIVEAVLRVVPLVRVVGAVALVAFEPLDRLAGLVRVAGDERPIERGRDELSVGPHARHVVACGVLACGELVSAVEREFRLDGA
ncbi:hypothetical protein LDC_2439, partial [sediment metagenome]